MFKIAGNKLQYEKTFGDEYTVYTYHTLAEKLTPKDMNSIESVSKNKCAQ